MDESKLAVATYDLVADKYTQQYFTDLTDAPYIDKFLEQIPKNGKILDLGCGPGTFSKYIHQKGFDVVGIDLSQSMLAIAKQKVPEVEFLRMDMRHLSFPDEYYDGILAAYSLIHIPTKEIAETLSGFYAALKPSGWAMIIAQKGEPDHFEDEPLKEGEKIFVNFFTLNRLIDHLERAGFTIVYQEETGMLDEESMSNTVLYILAHK